MTCATLETWLPREKLKGSPSRIPIKRASGTLWPHGEFSQGWAKARPDGGEWHEDPYIGMGVDDVPSGRDVAAETAALHLSDVRNSHNRPQRGLKGITGHGRQMVKAFGFLLKEKWPRHRVTLGTVTLPPMEQAQREAVAVAWPELVRHYLQWLSRRLERQGLPPAVCSVTEIQPKRLQETGEGYLHLHTLWLNRPGRKGNWAVSPVDLRAWLSQWLYRHIPGYPGGHVNVNVKPVRGEVARYMAKYMSKGGECLGEAIADWGEAACPRTWWNMTSPARAMVKAETHKGFAVGEYLESLLNYLWDTGDDSWVEFLRHVELDLDGVRVTVGYRGRMSKDVLATSRAMLKSLHM